MPIIEATLVAGRDPDAVRAFLGRLHDAAVDVLGAPADSVRVVLREVPPAHWMIGGATVAERRTP